MKNNGFNDLVVIVMLLTVVGCATAQSFSPPHMNAKLPQATPHTASHATKTTSVSPAPSPNAVAVKQADHGNPGDIDCSKIHIMEKKYSLPGGTNKGKVEWLKVGATGYGAPPKNYYPEGQRRLMTIRASKIDAYRALAEVVGGLHIWGGTTISAMVVERDRYRVFVDTYVRGARIVSVAGDKDGTYQTSVEMEVDQRFLWQVMTFVDPSLARECDKQEAPKGSYAYYGNGTSVPTFYYSE